MIKSPNETVRVESHENLLTITLNRPHRLNVLNLDMTEALSTITAAIRKESNIRAVLLKGAGEHFMAGGDLKFFKEMRDGALDRSSFAQAFKQLIPKVQAPINELRKLHQPVLASVQGSVAGYGFSLMNACDMVIAANNTVFTIAYPRIGTSPDGGSTWTLPRVVGYRRAFELMALGDKFDAPTAHSFGIVNQLAELTQLEQQTTELAHRLVEAPALAIGNTKRLLSDSPGNNLEQQLSREGECFVECSKHSDFEEGISAFLDKRAANFNT